MIDPDKEKLVEGGSYIQSFDNTFKPERKELRFKYNFELITDTLESFGFKEDIKHIVEVIVFDALIGNSDRHQENWAFITEHSHLSKTLDQIEYDLKNPHPDSAPNWLKKILSSLYFDGGANELKPEFGLSSLLWGKMFALLLFMTAVVVLVGSCRKTKFRQC